MKGIVLAGGSGSRLFPLTSIGSKHLLPVFDKPMVYYPIALLMLANIKDILIITADVDIDRFERLLGNGSQFGINIAYKIQEKPRGIVDAFILGEDFIGHDNVMLILGDNVLHGKCLGEQLENAIYNVENKKMATIFGCHVSNPYQYGVAEVDHTGRVLSIEEKPVHPKSNICVPGLYFYDNSVVQKAKTIKPSKRGELEITDLNNLYAQEERLQLLMLDSSTFWQDAGTPEGLLKAGNYIMKTEVSNNRKIGCLEEIAFEKNWVEIEELKINLQKMEYSPYKEYIESVLNAQQRRDVEGEKL